MAGRKRIPRNIIECECGCGALMEDRDKKGNKKRYLNVSHSVIHRQKGKAVPHFREFNKERKTKHFFVEGAEGKHCTECDQWKPLKDYGLRTRSWDKLNTKCKECCRVITKEYYQKNREKILMKQRTEEYKARHRQKRRERDRIRRRTDPNYKLKHILRVSLRDALKQGKKSKHTLDLLGCTIDELRMHLQFQFLPGMAWNNWSQAGWEIDHIIPISAFDLSRPEHQERCFRYSNLQPLWHDDNMLKGDYVPEGMIV